MNDEYYIVANNVRIGFFQDLYTATSAMRYCAMGVVMNKEKGIYTRQ